MKILDKILKKIGGFKETKEFGVDWRAMGYQ
jgi:hypothetical protein